MLVELTEVLSGGQSVEARSVAFTDIEASKDGSHFEGYAAVFDQVADLGQWTEEIERGAFRKVLTQSDNIPMLYDHNPNLPVLATTKAGTLKLSEDGKGLRVSANIGNHFIAEAVREMISRDEIRGMSYGFVAGEGNSKVEARGAGGKPHRRLVNFKALLDVSPTWDPAFDRTSAELRSLWAAQVAISQDLPQTVLVGDHLQVEELVAEELEDGGDEVEVRHDDSGATEINRLAARKRRLSMYTISLKGEL